MHTAIKPLGEWGQWSLQPNMTLQFRNGIYEIDLEQITSSAAICDWIFQIGTSGKEWATPQATTDLLLAFRDILDPQRFFCSGGVERKNIDLPAILAKFTRRLEIHVCRVTSKPDGPTSGVDLRDPLLHRISLYIRERGENVEVSWDNFASGLELQPQAIDALLETVEKIAIPDKPLHVSKSFAHFFVPVVKFDKLSAFLQAVLEERFNWRHRVSGSAPARVDTIRQPAASRKGAA